MKLEKEAKQPSEMANRRENEAMSGQKKAEGRGIERASTPCGVHFQKNLLKKKKFFKFFKIF